MSTVYKDQRSVGELLSDLAHETTTLVRQEVELAKTEMSEKATALGKDLAAIAVGGAILYAGVLVLLAAATIGLAYAIGPFWSALVVGALVTIIGGAMIATGLKKMKEQSLSPDKTKESIKETKTWAREQMKST